MSSISLRTEHNFYILLTFSVLEIFLWENAFLPILPGFTILQLLNLSKSNLGGVYALIVIC